MEKITIGRYTISKWRGELYIGNVDQEGGVFDEEEFEKAIEEFFWEHF